MNLEVAEQNQNSFSLLGSTLKNLILSFIRNILDFLIPRECPSCRKKLLPDENIICTCCFQEIRIAAKTRLNFEYRRKLSQEKIISGIFTPFVFEKAKPLQHLIHSLKYEKRYQNGLYLGKLTGRLGSETFSNWNIDLVIPIPLHKLRKSERGYNQSEYIAKGISAVTNLPIDRKALRRKRMTLTQTKMNIVQRKQNIRNAFFVKKPLNVKGKTILLVDDVITTGSTVAECGRVLLESGALKIYAASIGIAD